MSVTSFLLLLLLCLSLHACDARRLDVIDKKLEKKFRAVNQSNKQEISVIPNVDSSASNEHRATKDDNMTVTQMNDSTRKLNDSKDRQKLMIHEKAKESGAAQKEALVSVSWRVPHNKRNEKHPGFNLDYSPPKTHPPSHN